MFRARIPHHLKRGFVRDAENKQETSPCTYIFTFNSTYLIKLFWFFNLPRWMKLWNKITTWDNPSAARCLGNIPIITVSLAPYWEQEDELLKIPTKTSNNGNNKTQHHGLAHYSSSLIYREFSYLPWAVLTTQGPVVNNNFPKIAVHFSIPSRIGSKLIPNMKCTNITNIQKI